MIKTTVIPLPIAIMCIIGNAAEPQGGYNGINFRGNKKIWRGV